MKPGFKRILFTSLLCVGIAACSSDDDDDGGNGNNDDSGLTDGGDAGGTSAPAPGTTPTEVVNAFDGTWESNCAQVLELTGFSEFQQATLVVSGDAYVSTVNSFTDSDCSVEAVPAQAVVDFSLQLPGGEVETPLGTATFIDQEPESILVDGIDVSALQALAGFGTQFTIFLIADDGFLRFGNPADSAAERPTTLNTTVFFELQ